MRKKIIKILLVILWMGLIFYFSSRNSDESTDQSRSIVNKTNIVTIYEEKRNVDDETAIKNVDIFFRKSAHIIEYFVLTILLFYALIEYDLSIPKILLLSFMICFIYSISDEMHQLLVSGRSAEIKDILIDNIGNSLGILMCYLFKRRKL